MKRFYLLSVSLFLFSFTRSSAQNDAFLQPINQTGISLRSGPIVLGSITQQFPSDGYVVVHFDGECYASVGDKIILAASNTGDWETNDGNVEVETSKAGFARPFSHTRVYAVTAGSHTFYAVGQNYVETDGNGLATIFGNLSVEYFPETSNAKVEANGFVFQGNVVNSTVVGSQTIHATGAGKVLVRFDGLLVSAPGDRIVLAASNTTNWDFNDLNVAVEAVNEGDVDGNSFSHTRVYNIPSAGDYTYNAIADQYGEASGTGDIEVYGNLLVEFIPGSNAEKVLFKGYTMAPVDLNGEPHELASLTLDAPSAGKALVSIDGYLTSNEGFDNVLAASNALNWSGQSGSIKLRALDNDQNRYSYSHTRLYDITAGSHTFYAVGETINGSGHDTAYVFGELTVKYFPSGPTVVDDIIDSKYSFDIYPNPVNDLVHLSFENPLDQKMKIQLLDANGRVLNEYKSNGKKEMTIDLSSFPVNQYWIKVSEVMKAVVRM